MFRRTLLIIYCLAALQIVPQSVSMRAAVPQVRAEFSKDSISIGDQFTLDIVVNKDVMQIVDFPAFENAMLTDRIHIVSESSIDTLTQGREQTLSKQYTLTIFKPGLYETAGFPVMYIDKNIVDTLYSSTPLRIMVTTFEVDTDNETVNPIKIPENTPFLGAEIFGYTIWSFVGACVAAALIFLILRILRRRKRPESEGNIIHRDPPHIVAIRELEDLHNRKLWQNDRHKQYYSNLTDILREYIGRRYDTSVMEKTTDEIVGVSETFGLDRINHDRLFTLLRTADLVKFAKYIPDVDYNEKAFLDAYYFVEDTKAVTETNGAAEENGSGNAAVTNPDAEDAKRKEVSDEQ